MCFVELSIITVDVVESKSVDWSIVYVKQSRLFFVNNFICSILFMWCWFIVWFFFKKFEDITILGRDDAHGISYFHFSSHDRNMYIGANLNWVFPFVFCVLHLTCTLTVFFLSVFLLFIGFTATNGGASTVDHTIKFTATKRFVEKLLQKIIISSLFFFCFVLFIPLENDSGCVTQNVRFSPQN